MRWRFLSTTRRNLRRTLAKAQTYLTGWQTGQGLFTKVREPGASHVVVWGATAKMAPKQTKTNNKPKKSNNVVYADEATYLLDRRLAAALTAKTDNNGASGAGTGSSYGATYYRSMAYKQAAAIAKQKNSTYAVNNK